MCCLIVAIDLFLCCKTQLYILKIQLFLFCYYFMFCICFFFLRYTIDMVTITLLNMLLILIIIYIHGLYIYIGFIYFSLIVGYCVFHVYWICGCILLCLGVIVSSSLFCCYNRCMIVINYTSFAANSNNINAA